MRVSRLKLIAAWLLLPLLLLAGAPSHARDSGLRIYGMESRPLSFQDGNHVDGMVVELARAIQARLGATDRIEIIPWARAGAMVFKEPNVLVLSMIRTEERAQTIRFIGPVAQANMSAYAVRSRAAGLRAAGARSQALRVGFRRGSVYAEIAERLGYRQVNETNSSEAAARMLMAGRFDLWFDHDEFVPGAMRQAGHRPDEVEPVFSLGKQSIFMAFSPGTPAATVQAWDETLRELKRSGAYQKIHDKWLPAEILPQHQRRSPP